MKLKGAMFQKAAAVLAAVMFLSGSVFAGEVDKLTSILAEKGLISYGEAQQIMTESSESSRQLTASGANPSLPAWIQNMTMKGDIRLRHQIDWNSSDNTRNRDRIRVRFGIETRPVESIKAAFGIASAAQVASGDKNPTSTNHTFQAFNKVPLFIDYAYLQYDPVNWFKVSGGKVKNGAQSWNPTDLIWDTDINPDGVAANFDKSVSSDINIFANAGWYVLNEGSKGNLMPDVYIVQPGAAFKSGNILVKAGIGYQQFNTKNKAPYGSNEPASYLGDNASYTNATNFQLLNPAVEVKLKEIIGSYGISFFYEYVKNMDNEIYKNNLEGRIFGINFGSDKIAELGTWQVKLMNRYLESYAIPLGLGDSDAYGGKPNSKGYEIIATLGLTKNLSCAVDYYQMEQINGDKNPKSLAQFDLIYKF